MESLRRTSPLFLPLGLFLAAIVTRYPFKSNLLYSMDSGHFALALKNYNVLVHQPHPPGYFLYVMLGRVFHRFLVDANLALVSISIIFSGLMVAALYLLGTDLFDRKIGILAALIGITSPALWFNGEVALTYATEAFFSTFIALCCWRVTKGETLFLWISAAAMGFSGGFRQVTPVFLLPLWMYSIAGVPLRKIILSFVLMVFITLLWALPMLHMTGGWSAYYGAFLELWTYNTGHYSVIEKGWPVLKLYSATLLRFFAYGTGTWIFPLVLALYVVLRQKRVVPFDRMRMLFLSIWVLPAFLFYLLVFIHPANPGYALIFMPAIFVVAARSLEYICTDLQRFTKMHLFPALAMLLILLNACWFILSKSPVSYGAITNHERELSYLLEEIQSFSPKSTAIFIAKPYVYFSFRHIMYYLPGYTVYQIDDQVSPTGQKRKTFWGENRRTHLTGGIDLPGRFDKVVVLMDDADCLNVGEGVETRKRVGNSGLCIISGPDGMVETIFDGSIMSRARRRVDRIHGSP